ncbi:APC family permease [sulfur-oxidizing endosymbiont of Gigantopelta aegis]|uniref:APC family permease n=1 Tax=sulfur-oxidizing endosymbiont of Gigantopelta aegis TaxID=2794934 RepID=UPI0018DD0DE6|nr:APC family permease [sulfur-oxidizing endosymbiont of Gigantopelta aegis]
MNKKNGTIGLLGAISIGIGGMVGGGIFAVLGEAVSLAHGATAIAFLVAGIVALLTSYSYAKLSVTYKSRGGTVLFIDKAFNHNLLAGSVNLMLWLSYLVTISLYAVAFASYGQTFFPNNETAWLKHLLISLAILLPVAINLISASFVSKSETLIVIIKIILLVFIIAASASYVDIERLSPMKWGSSFSIVVSGMIIFVAYEGFELISNAAEDIKNPDTNLPRAFYGSVLLVILLYVLIAIITVGTVPESQLVMAKDYALAVAAKPALGQVGFTIVAVAALLATFSAINATIYGNARLSYMLAKEGELPESLANEKRNIPTLGVILTAALSLIMANSIDLSEIAIIGSASFLLIFFIVNVAAYKLHKAINASKKITVLASLVSFMALMTLLIHTYSNTPRAIVIFLSFIAISFLFELSYGKIIRKHIFSRPY